MSLWMFQQKWECVQHLICMRRTKFSFSSFKDFITHCTAYTSSVPWLVGQIILPGPVSVGGTLSKTLEKFISLPIHVDNTLCVAYEHPQPA